MNTEELIQYWESDLVEAERIVTPMLRYFFLNPHQRGCFIQMESPDYQDWAHSRFAELLPSISGDTKPKGDPALFAIVAAAFAAYTDAIADWVKTVPKDSDES